MRPRGILLSAVPIMERVYSLVIRRMPMPPHRRLFLRTSTDMVTSRSRTPPGGSLPNSWIAETRHPRNFAGRRPQMMSVTPDELPSRDIPASIANEWVSGTAWCACRRDEAPEDIIDRFEQALASGYELWAVVNRGPGLSIGPSVGASLAF